MEMFTLVMSRVNSPMAWVATHGQMAQFMMVIGKMERCVVEVESHGLLEQVMRVIFLVDISMVLAH